MGKDFERLVRHYKLQGYSKERAIELAREGDFDNDNKGYKKSSR